MMHGSRRLLCHGTVFKVSGFSRTLFKTYLNCQAEFIERNWEQMGKKDIVLLLSTHGFHCGAVNVLVCLCTACLVKMTLD